MNSLFSCVLSASVAYAAQQHSHGSLTDAPPSVNVEVTVKSEVPSAVQAVVTPNSDHLEDDSELGSSALSADDQNAMIYKSLISRGLSNIAMASRMVPRPLNIVFVGPPGVGKGTYGSRLHDLFGIPHISTGDIIRKMLKEDRAPKGVAEVVKNGGLIADKDVIAMVNTRLSDPDVKNGYLLDGFPRTVHQAQELLKSQQISLALVLTLPDDILLRKLTGRRVCKNCGTGYNVADIHENEYVMPALLPHKEGFCDAQKCKEMKVNAEGVLEAVGKLEHRADDTLETATKRLALYKDETFPVIDVFHKHDSKLVRRFEPKKGLDDFAAIVDLVTLATLENQFPDAVDKTVTTEQAAQAA